MVNIILAAFVISEPLTEEEPVSDVVDEGTELAGENITLHIANTCVIYIKKLTMPTVASKSTMAI